MWLKDDSYEGIIKESWGMDLASSSVWDFFSKLSTFQENLKIWNCTAFGHVHHTPTKNLKELHNVEESDCYRNNPSRIYVLRDEIQKLKSKEEAM